MSQMTNEELLTLIDKATAGDKRSLETVLLSVQDLVFNLSLRMLGSFPDAEDATQDILLKVITYLSSFKKDSAFSTWVFRIASNHLQTYKKHMFAKFPLSFEFYGDDIVNGKIDDVPDLTQDVERSVLAEELKISCTNVMLQCLDPESRCIFILGTMFRVDSQIAGDILGITPEAYRQRLSRPPCHRGQRGDGRNRRLRPPVFLLQDVSVPGPCKGVPTGFSKRNGAFHHFEGLRRDTNGYPVDLTLPDRPGGKQQPGMVPRTQG